MVEYNNEWGCQLFSTGKSILLNWGNQGNILENPRITRINFNMRNYSGPEFITVLGERKGEILQKAVPLIEVEMTMMISDLKLSEKPFKFEELLKEDMTMEEMLKVAYSKTKEEK